MHNYKLSFITTAESPGPDAKRTYQLGSALGRCPSSRQGKAFRSGKIATHPANEKATLTTLFRLEIDILICLDLKKTGLRRKSSSSISRTNGRITTHMDGLKCRRNILTSGKTLVNVTRLGHVQRKLWKAFWLPGNEKLGESKCLERKASHREVPVTSMKMANPSKCIVGICIPSSYMKVLYSSFERN
jgi:hypothetical protein